MSNQDAVKFLKNDPNLSKIINQVGEFKIKKTRNRFQSLIEAIITQQLSGSAANSIIKKFRIIYGLKFPQPIDIIRTNDSKLRKSGLSRMKISYIKELSKKIETKKIKLKTISKLDNEEIISELTQVRGIGRWTSEMFLIFSLGRQDVLPVGDLGLRKAIQHLFSLPEIPSESKIEELAERWKPYRTAATWYLWKSLQKFETIG